MDGLGGDRREEEAVVAKEKKTEGELTALIMNAIRQHPEFNNITDVVVNRPPQRSADDPNWGFEFLVSGGPLAPARAFEIAEQVRRKYDLA
jgi:hypothetical protein